MRNLVQLVVLLLVYGALVLAFPEMTVSPGDLVEGHEPVADACFRCHSAFLGTPSEKCLACHELEEIGVFETTGEPIARDERRPRFHQALLEPGCVQCHSDHLGAGRPGPSTAFTHDLLREDALSTCGDCHGEIIPRDALHRAAAAACGSCHGFEAWTPATFDHAMLATDRREACATCHADVRPSDDLHLQSGDDCGACHTTDAWKPATFDHDDYFRFDRHHPASPCQSCHPDALHLYTCYGCHEHTPRGVAREHREEGIKDFENCVECHRSGDEHEAERRFRRSRKSRSDDD